MTLTHNIDATINGTWYYDSTDSPAPPGPVSGTVTGGFVIKDMAPVVAAARPLAGLDAGLAPNETRATLNQNGDTINGCVSSSGCTYVLRLTDAVTMKKDLTINAAAGSKLIIQVATSDSGHVLTLSGMNMILNGGITGADITWVLNGHTDAGPAD